MNKYILAILATTVVVYVADYYWTLFQYTDWCERRGGVVITEFYHLRCVRRGAFIEEGP